MKKKYSLRAASAFAAFFAIVFFAIAVVAGFGGVLLRHARAITGECSYPGDNYVVNGSLSGAAITPNIADQSALFGATYHDGEASTCTRSELGNSYAVVQGFWYSVVDGSGALVVPSSSLALQANCGRGSVECGPGITHSVSLPINTAGYPNGAYRLKVTLSGVAASGMKAPDVNLTYSFSVQHAAAPVGTGVITVISRSSVIVASTTYSESVSNQPGVVSNPPPYADKGGALFGPAGKVMCGMRSTGKDNHGTVVVDEPIYCDLSQLAKTAGLSITGNSYRIDSSNNGAAVGPCNVGDVVTGAEWAKNNQLDYGYCQTLTSNTGKISWDRSSMKEVTPAVYTDSYCPTDSLVVGGQNAPAKNDSWNGFYCAKILVPTTTVSAGMGVPVAADWDFMAADSTGAAIPDLCSTSIAGAVGCSGISQATYSQLSFGTYTIQPLTAKGYAFGGIKKIAVAEDAPSAKSFFVPVAKAWSIPPSNPQTQTICQCVPTANFIILWDPIAALSVNTGNVSLTANDLATKQVGTFIVSNIGANGSRAMWTASAATTDTNWLSVNMPASGDILAGTSQTITVTADPAIAGSGSHTGTITIGGTTDPTGRPLNPVTVTVTFDVTAPAPCQGLNNPRNGCPQVPTKCSLVPDPASVVIPQKSALVYHCENVTSCTLSGGEIPSPIAITPATTTVDGTRQVSPMTNPSIYTLGCQGEATSSSNYSWSTSVQVNVATAARAETAP